MYCSPLWIEGIVPEFPPTCDVTGGFSAHEWTRWRIVKNEDRYGRREVMPEMRTGPRE